MTIRLICVGKIKESFFSEGIAEYKKRLSRFISFEIIEVKDEKTKENASEKEENLIRDKEGERILEKIREGDHVIALSIKGKKYTSEGFSEYIGDLMNRGVSSVTFIIGGSIGLSEAVLKRADSEVSFSDMTFPHQLMRLIFTEQLYRAFKIMNNEPYHK